jgi:dolichol-phosphate mannosyltransferase
MVQISVVIPVYMAERVLDSLVIRLCSSLLRIGEDFEILLIEDGSSDRSWEKIMEECRKDKRVKGIRLSRNFGQHHAITAGLDYCKGEWVVVMDCDLQERPEEIEILYRKACEGYDIVLARRAMREDGFLKRVSSKVFYRLFDYVTDTKTDPTVGSFRILSRKVVKHLTSMREQIRFFGGMVQWLGFKTAYVDVEHSVRHSGKSSYSLIKLINLSLNAMIGFSNKPLKIFIKLGFFMSLVSLIYGVYLFLKKILFGIDVPGWTSTIVSLYFIGGLLFMNLGMLGIYIGRIFDEAKKRPLYAIDELVNYE